MDIKGIINKINWFRFGIGLVLGAIGGFAYYYYVGCASGTCPIKSNPVIMTLYGSGMGGILFFGYKKDSKENPNPKNN